MIAAQINLSIGAILLRKSSLLSHTELVARLAYLVNVDRPIMLTSRSQRSKIRSLN
jgi:hypothetical protein